MLRTMNAAGNPWLRRHAGVMFALTTTLLWGVWGAFADLPSQHDFPETLIYVVWAVTMIPPALYVLGRSGWKLPTDVRSVLLGTLIGLTGAGGQMVLFHALRVGPPYLIFPLIALSPIITIAMSLLWLGERSTRLGALAIALAVIALPLLEYVPGHGFHSQGVAWFFYSLVILAAWGVQAFFIKLANRTMTAEGIFFYMTLMGLALIPVALWMTNFSRPINFGWSGPYLAAATQILNSIGALTLVYAFRYGKAIIVSPLTNAGAPLITAVLSLMFLAVVPNDMQVVGMSLAFVAAALLAIEPEEPA